MNPQKKNIGSIPSTSTKHEPKKVIAKTKPKTATSEAKPKQLAKKKILTANNQEVNVSNLKKKARNSEEEKWVELLQPERASVLTRISTQKQPAKPTRNTPQVKERATQPVPASKSLAKKNTPSVQAKQATAKYKASLRNLIDKQKKYPSKAKRRGDEGIVMVSFVISANGQINNIKVMTSSGSRILDSEAIDTVKKASGKLPFPAAMQKSQLSFNLPLTYRLR